MAFRVEITPAAEKQIEQTYLWYRERNPEFADRWFRELMKGISTLQEKPRRCPLALENEIFADELRQLLHGKGRSTFRILFTLRDNAVLILFVRHASQEPLGPEDFEGL
jgi:plasmid stabilization system protein ParE